MSAPSPVLSVLIATHNRRELLRRCLGALAAQDQDPQSFEVVVADDGSDDGTAAMAETFEAPFGLRVLPLERGGQPRAFNAAVAAAAGEIGLILDDDVIASPGLVSAHVRAHREDPMTIGIGKIVQQPPDRRDWYAETQARIWNLHYDEFDRREATWVDCYGANLSAPLSQIRAVGGMDERMVVTLDLDLAYRLCEAGCTPRYLAGASCVHDDQKPRRKMLAGAHAQGVSHVELVRRVPATRPQMLAWHSGGPREIALRRRLLSMRVPAAPFARLGRLVPGEDRQLLWFSIVARYAFWRGAKTAMTAAEWEEATNPETAG
jgi:GT2 family glycosyltransferase